MASAGGGGGPVAQQTYQAPVNPTAAAPGQYNPHVPTMNPNVAALFPQPVGMPLGVPYNSAPAATIQSILAPENTPSYGGGMKDFYNKAKGLPSSTSSGYDPDMLDSWSFTPPEAPVPKGVNNTASDLAAAAQVARANAHSYQ